MFEAQSESEAKRVCKLMGWELNGRLAGIVGEKGFVLWSDEEARTALNEKLNDIMKEN